MYTVPRSTLVNLLCNAAASLWSDEGRQREFAARGLALLHAEVRSIEAATEATERLAAGASTATE